MATIAIGDIHGNLAALNDILEQVLREIAGDDTVVFLGDYIDPGYRPSSQELLRSLGQRSYEPFKLR